MARQQALHREDGLWPSSHQPFDWAVDCLWGLTDFTVENGATLVVPRSHRWRRERPAERPDLAVRCEMAAGSVLMWAGAALHAGGASPGR
jgi:ectoine hydroxylase-related dioxygenase (phytanoyl-CoA dioxygenase family)